MSSGVGMPSKRSHDGETKQQQQQRPISPSAGGGDQADKDKDATTASNSISSSGNPKKDLSSQQSETAINGSEGRGAINSSSAGGEVVRKKGRPKSPMPKNGKSDKSISGNGKQQQQQRDEGGGPSITPTGSTKGDDNDGTLPLKSESLPANVTNSSTNNNSNSNNHAAQHQQNQPHSQPQSQAAAAHPNHRSSSTASSSSQQQQQQQPQQPQPQSPLSITAEEVNFLIYRYLQESGFVHTSFTFAHESLVGRSRPRNSSSIPPGALILFLQKGLQYVGMEESLMRELEVESGSAAAAAAAGSASAAASLKSQDGAASAAGGAGATASETAADDGEKLSRPNKKVKGTAAAATAGAAATDTNDKDNDITTDPNNNATSMGPNFSLLCPRALHTLTRKDPPIKLRVPPASAAAATKARMEMEEKIARERRAMELEEEKERRKIMRLMKEEKYMVEVGPAEKYYDTIVVEEKKSEKKKKMQLQEKGLRASLEGHPLPKQKQGKKGKGLVNVNDEVEVLSTVDAAVAAEEMTEPMPTPKKRKKKKKNAVVTEEEQQQPVDKAAAKEKAFPMEVDDVDTTKQRQKQSERQQLQQQQQQAAQRGRPAQQQQQVAMGVGAKGGTVNTAAGNSMNQIEATAAAMRAAASGGGMFPPGMAAALSQMNSKGVTGSASTPVGSVGGDQHSSRGGTPTVGGTSAAGGRGSGGPPGGMHHPQQQEYRQQHPQEYRQQQEYREMEMKRMQEAQRFQEAQRMQEAQHRMHEAQRMEGARQMWEMQHQGGGAGGNGNRGAGGGGGPVGPSSDRGPPQAYTSMDASNMSAAQEAAEVARQRAEIQAVLAQRQQAVHAMAQGGGSSRDQQQQQPPQGREDDSARATIISEYMALAGGGNVSAEEAVSRMGVAAAAMGNARPGMQNYPDGSASNGMAIVNSSRMGGGGSNGKTTPMDVGQQSSGNAGAGVGSKKHTVQDQRSNVPVNDGGGQSAASIEEEDMLTSIHPSEVMELSQHTSEVFMCAWNPRFTNLIATGSGDASARIWGINGPNASAGCQQSILLPHGQDSTDRKNKDVTTLEWSSSGELLATGSYDGVARVWSRSGELRQTLRGHRGPIFSLKWNKRGNFLLSGSYDKSTIVWDVSGEVGFVKQQFSFHFAPALDVDWKDDLTFASCSTDKTVQICRVGHARPIKTYTGHADEVNAVKWDPSGTLLASCSDDCTAKVWDVNSPRNEPKWDFKSHQQEIYTVKWSPTGPGSKNPNKLLMLATASFDGSVRLWNVVDGTCLRILSRHRESVYSVAFSPSGDYLASGSLAGQLYIWNVRDGVHIKSFKGKGDIFEVAWNIEESRVAACFSSNVVSVIDFKRP